MSKAWYERSYAAWRFYPGDAKAALRKASKDPDRNDLSAAVVKLDNGDMLVKDLHYGHQKRCPPFPEEIEKAAEWVMWEWAKSFTRRSR